MELPPADANPETDEPEAAKQAEPTPRRGRARRIIAGVLIVLTGLLSIVTLLAGYVRGELLDTERYVEIVGPLARDPAVKAEVVEAVTAAVVDNVSLEGLTEDVLELLRARDGRLGQLLNSDQRLGQAVSTLLSGLGPMLQNQLETATRRAAERIVESPRFDELWTEANRAAHRAMLAALRDEGELLRTDDGEVRIDVAVIVAEVRQRLVESGVPLADRIPDVDTEIVLVQSAELAKAQRLLALFDQWAPWLPWITIAVGIAAVAVAPGRRRAVQWLGVSIAVAMIVTAIALAVGRRWFLGRVANSSVDPAAIAAVVDAALSPLWSRLIFMLVAAALIAVVALLVGPVGARLRDRIISWRRKSPA